MFPQARFVHIYRDPWAIFPSTINLWKRLYADQCLQKPRFEGLEDYVFETFNRMYAAFERDRPLIPAKQFAEVSYEQLVADPVGQMRRIYDELDLGGFDELRPVLEDYRRRAEELPEEPFRDAPRPARRDQPPVERVHREVRVRGEAAGSRPGRVGWVKAALAAVAPPASPWP